MNIVRAGFVSFVAVTALACSKDDHSAENVTPVLSFQDGSARIQDGKAAVTLSLSAPASKDVAVGLYVDGALASLLAFDSAIVIPQGERSKVVDITAQTGGLAPGFYESELYIASVDGARMNPNANVVRLGLTVTGEDAQDKPQVLLHRTNFDADTGRGELYVYINRRSGTDVVVTLEQADKVNSATAVRIDASALSFDKEVTIPAGEKEVAIPVTVNLSGIQAGTNEAVIRIVSVSGDAEVGEASEAVFSISTSAAVRLRTDWTATYKGIEEHDGYYYFVFNLAGTRTSFYDLRWRRASEPPSNLVTFCEETSEQCLAEYRYLQTYYPGVYTYSDCCYYGEGTGGAAPSMGSAPAKGDYILYVVGLYGNLTPTYEYATLSFTVE